MYYYLIILFIKKHLPDIIYEEFSFSTSSTQVAAPRNRDAAQGKHSVILSTGQY
jgi:hypothetical protein